MPGYALDLHMCWKFGRYYRDACTAKCGPEIARRLQVSVRLVIRAGISAILSHPGSEVRGGLPVAAYWITEDGRHRMCNSGQ